MTTYLSHVAAAARIYRLCELRLEMSYRRSLDWLSERADETWSERNLYNYWIQP